MQASYVESSFYNIYYKNSQNNMGNGQTHNNNSKKLRFAPDVDTEESAFGFDPPAVESGNEIAMKTGIGFKSGFKKVPFKSDNSNNDLNNVNPVENMANEVLVNCNAIFDKKLVSDKMLKKGEGKTTAGSGKTNLQMYQTLL